ncbi:hypothetical protein P152DRAFT_155043 [Eremomyces bilateralis CBS 781.70]|uniref:CENP-V/GFA domain-containing protein n=1 Tax=Eremomyces bilateralis CBS 781.70 TaxID=1392243 RepID=A0A6G1FV37_9PEZI|nr:uncharacterized protein P152DRAFT_155043 [Eremomyces bilateralis CBS 781.70]KAF1809623.1 hypothetical protein P152DRAFT_155043 [Eremomyces bilateralis CBS 781.70]
MSTSVPETMSGSCDCGAVKVTVTDVPIGVNMCFCSHCRINSGGSSQVAVLYTSEQVKIEDPDSVRKGYTMEDTMSGNPKTKIFCGTCGCHVYSEGGPKEGRMYGIRGPILDRTLETLKPTLQEVFEHKRPSFMGSIKSE